MQALGGGRILLGKCLGASSDMDKKTPHDPVFPAWPSQQCLNYHCRVTCISDNCTGS